MAQRYLHNGMEDWHDGLFGGKSKEIATCYVVVDSHNN
jgi:hypothetical protein